jgi:hypothetical protein
VTIRTCERRTPKWSARRRIRASLAAPSTGGAVRRALRTPGAISRISLFEARGMTRTWKRRGGEGGGWAGMVARET